MIWTHMHWCRPFHVWRQQRTEDLFYLLNQVTCHTPKVCRKTCMHTWVSDHQSPPFHINTPAFRGVWRNTPGSTPISSQLSAHFCPPQSSPSARDVELRRVVMSYHLSDVCVRSEWCDWGPAAELCQAIGFSVCLLVCLSSLLCLTVIRQVCCVRVLECVYMSCVSVFL